MERLMYAFSIFASIAVAIFALYMGFTNGWQ